MRRDDRDVAEPASASASAVNAVRPIAIVVGDENLWHAD